MKLRGFDIDTELDFEFADYLHKNILVKYEFQKKKHFCF